MVLMKKLLMFVAVGALLGMVAGSFIGPKYAEGYQPPSRDAALCNCLDTARDAARAVIQVQLISAAVGAVVFLIFGVVLSVRGRGNGGTSGPSVSTPV